MSFWGRDRLVKLKAIGDSCHVDESDWNGRDRAVCGLTGGRAPGLEQEHNVGTRRRAGVSYGLRRCGGLGTADADRRASLMCHTAWQRQRRNAR